ncbi:ethanolaminephosphotransferase [Strigomonas culicis]|uniref:Ethanolaminephosphotransferase n=1 Tax=Strigomonas culicis TaxID=28005 RepID=S9VL41_9TRYP|nr:ethanolaminephosphotransferase [Strigomonas culicis]|eukprot:EPY27831.1 ethanolaminephosphotransferase [Strigomonas culicis]
MGDSILYSPAAPADKPHVGPTPSYLAEYVLFPFYDWFVLFYPKSWMPNTVTLCGVGATLLSSLLLLCAMPSDAAFTPGRPLLLPWSWVEPGDAVPTPLYPTRIVPRPAWLFDELLSKRLCGGLVSGALLLYSLCGVLNLSYCVADNTDGRLARRDRKTSLIGEYLDHGLDCVTSLLSVCMLYAVLGCSLSNMAVSISLIAVVTIISHTLNYEQSIFIWGTRIASVDEAMLLFGFAMWIPNLWPVGTVRVPVAVLESALSFLPAAAQQSAVFYASRLTCIEWVYVFYNLVQLQTIAQLSSYNWRMLFRLPTLFMIANFTVLLATLPRHAAKVAAAGGAADALTGYTLGPIPYPGLWMLVAASTGSIIVHVVISAKCAGLRRPDMVPLAGVLFMWAAFVASPAGAVLLGAAIHVVQIFANIRLISERRQKK